MTDKFNLVGNAHLDLTCRKCTRSASFHAMTIPQAVQESIQVGWVRESDGTPMGGYYICPKCPTVRVHVSDKRGVIIGHGDHQEVVAQAEAMVEPSEGMLA